MSRARFDRVAAIASRQPELNPARHVSPAIVETRLQIALADRDKARADVADLRAVLLNVAGELTAFCEQSDLMPDDCAKAITAANALLVRLDKEDKS